MITDFTSDIAEAAYFAITRNRKQYARWAEAIDCLRVEKDLPEYREAYEVPDELPPLEAKMYILAEMLEVYYAEQLPSLESPFGEILLEAFNEVNWLEIATKLWENVT